MRILITDDHALIRVGIKQVLLAGFGKVFIGEAQNAAETMEQIQRDTWDVLLLDITMPGRSGLDVLRDLKMLRPKLPILILSACSEDQFALRVLKIGASGFVRKECATEELVGAIKKVVDGGRYVTPALAERLAGQFTNGWEKAPHENLSDREYEVTCMIAKGRTPTQIASLLALSVKTISTYRARILEKLHLQSNAELTYYAIKNGLVD